MSESVSTVDPLLLAQLLCTRLAHDLAGPIGAVAAGVELTAGDPTQVDAETLGLIGNSSAAASRKLKFLRSAMGVPAGHSGAIGDLPGLVEGFLHATAGRSGPAALHWPESAVVATAATRVGVNAVPIILNLCLLVLEAQPMCRSLTLKVDGGITVIAEGDASRPSAWRSDVGEILNGGAVAPTAKSIQIHLLYAIAAQAGGRVLIESNGSTLQAAFSSS